MISSTLHLLRFTPRPFTLFQPCCSSPRLVARCERRRRSSGRGPPAEGLGRKPKKNAQPARWGILLLVSAKPTPPPAETPPGRARRARKAHAVLVRSGGLTLCLVGTWSRRGNSYLGSLGYSRYLFWMGVMFPSFKVLGQSGPGSVNYTNSSTIALLQSRVDWHHARYGTWGQDLPSFSGGVSKQSRRERLFTAFCRPSHMYHRPGY